MAAPKPCTIHVVGAIWQPGHDRVRRAYAITAADVHTLRSVPIPQRLAFLEKLAGDFREVRAFKLQSGRTRMRHAPDPLDAAALDAPGA